MEPNQETSENQLPSRRLMRKTRPSGVDEKHPDPRIEHVLTPHYSLLCQRVRTSVENRHNSVRLRNHVQNSHASESECIHHHYKCQFRPLYFHNTWLRHFNEDEREEMMLVTTGGHLGHILRVVFLLVPEEKFVHPPQNGPLPQVASSLHKESRLKRTC